MRIFKFVYSLPFLFQQMASVFADKTIGPFTVILKQQRLLSEPLTIYSDEEFNIRYDSDKIQPYSFILTDTKDVTIYSRIEQKEPYYMFGDKSGVPYFNVLKNNDMYKLTIKENGDNLTFYILDKASSSTTTGVTTGTTSLRTTTTTDSATSSTTVSDLKYCQTGFPVTFDRLKDHISLHYDMSYDPDDYLSAVADRATLESLYGTTFLTKQTTRVIGTCGGSCKGYNKPADKLMQYTFGDVGGYKVTVGANDPKVYSDAQKYELSYFMDTIKRGGRIFVKEGGESDFTKRVVEELEKWKSGSGNCVYIVQHSSTNEKNNGPGVLSYVKSKCNYIKISDGNPLYQKSNYKLNGKSFDFYGLQSKWECAWKLAFDDFKLIKSYCNGGKPEPVTKCVDFSDTHELLYVLGLDSSGTSGNLGMDGFVKQFLKLSTEKHDCGIAVVM